ncbi:hypothetical protein SAMN04488509_11359 [Aquimonas voraii]|uniref:Type IV pilus biogenesis n=1 Tax=Aquimonas voraii TaxID=265719 RepID=A0A1G6ZFJ3_9GAMM|nr:hypothetical protein SAMN04488509_11359 [Aquimonas voraii]
MHRMQWAWKVGLLGALVWSGEACAAGHPCAEFTEPGARLACYDRAFPPVTADLSSGQGLTEARPEQDFGLSERQVELSKPEAERASQVDRIEAVVAAVRSLKGGQREVVLENGQIWRVTEGGVRGPLRSGDIVNIRRTFAGGYLLSKPGGTGLRVRRLR